MQSPSDFSEGDLLYFYQKKFQKYNKNCKLGIETERKI